MGAWTQSASVASFPTCLRIAKRKSVPNRVVGRSRSKSRTRLISVADMLFYTLLPLLVAVIQTVTAGLGCNVAQAGAPEDLLYPGLFQDTQPGSRLQATACPDPFEVPAGSKAPFWYGVATASYQIEGAAKEGGRGTTIWDTFSAEPGHTAGGATGDMACDFYHHYPRDIRMMRALGIRNLRMSLAWSRIFPAGTGDMNQEGVKFYSDVIDTLLAHCIEPHVTLMHWDLPQALQDSYGGVLGPQFVADFAAYAEAAFSLFGDRVKFWATINEPSVICSNGFENGYHAPGRCSDRSRCPEGDSAREPGLCAYHLMLAHAAAVPAFRRLVPGGKISINTNLSPFFVPLTDSPEDEAATERLNRWVSGYFLDPLYNGDWTAERLELVGEEFLPRFTPEQQAQLKAAKPDFYAVNYYTGSYAFYDPQAFLQAGTTTTSADGVPLPQGDSDWLRVFPLSFRKLLAWLDRRYARGAPIIVTENGADVPNECAMPLLDSLCDTFRVDYFRDYIFNATEAVHKDGVNLQGYFAWSILDNFEWQDGYTKRFGLVHVDYATQRRYLKASALYLSRLFGVPYTPMSGLGQDFVASE